MKVYKNKNMQEWSPETGTHCSQRITLTREEEEKYNLHFPVGTHYPALFILDYFPAEVFKEKKLNYCNTCIKII